MASSLKHFALMQLCKAFTNLCTMLEVKTITVDEVAVSGYFLYGSLLKLYELTTKRQLERTSDKQKRLHLAFNECHTYVYLLNTLLFVSNNPANDDMNCNHFDNNSRDNAMIIRKMLAALQKDPSTSNSLNTTDNIFKAIKAVLHPIKVLGEGKTSNVLIAYNKESKVPACVIKAIKQEGHSYERINTMQTMLVHEVAIGYALNRYSKETDHGFAQFFAGLFYYNVDDQDKVTCISFQEHVQGFTLHNLIKLEVISKKPSARRIEALVNNVFYELIYTLNQAQKHLQFMHYDLHSQNVLINKLPSSVSRVLKFSDDFEITLLNVDTKIMIIDYGQACCKVEDTILYNRWPVFDDNIIACGNGIVSSDWMLPLFDAYRYISCSIIELSRLSDLLLPIIRNLFLKWMKPLRSFVVAYPTLAKWIDDVVKTLQSPASYEDKSFVEYQQMYIDKRLAYPKRDVKSAFLSGTLEDYMKAVEHESKRTVKQ